MEAANLHIIWKSLIRIELDEKVIQQ